MQEFISLVVLLIIVVISVLVSEFLANKGIIGRELSRKLLHIFASLTVVASIVIIKNYFILLAISLVVLGMLAFLISRDLIPSINDRHRKSWGIVFFPFSMFILLLIYPNDRQIIVLSFLIMGFADALAAIFGSRYGRNYFILVSDKKSLVGSGVFFAVTLLTVWVSAHWDFFTMLGGVSLAAYSGMELFGIAVISGILLTAFEMFGAKGSDNILVPLFASFILYTFGIFYNQELIFNLLTGITLGAIAGVLSYRLKFLTRDGAMAAFLLASFVYGYGGWKWTVPILTFFILSSLISKIRKMENADVDDYFEKTGTRDYLQVIANGGLAGSLVLLDYVFRSEMFYLVYIVFIAAACADTWSTEIGNIFRGKTFSIVSFRQVHPGVSGGVSWQGSLGGLAGSTAVIFSALSWIDIGGVITLILFGFAGTVIDSIFGATLQRHFVCQSCGIITEKSVHCSKPALSHSGMKYIDNDAVNLMACSLVGFAVFIFSYFL
ncbi:MAG TPA: DUF92 domain-containing protein [Ignavibacteriaceae bacterium]|nr:DUF92 domain-containing protein [Ignavibacteriaceae bacterium]